MVKITDYFKTPLELGLNKKDFMAYLKKHGKFFEAQGIKLEQAYNELVKADKGKPKAEKPTEPKEKETEKSK